MGCGDSRFAKLLKFGLDLFGRNIVGFWTITSIFFSVVVMYQLACVTSIVITAWSPFSKLINRVHAASGRWSVYMLKGGRCFRDCVPSFVERVC